MLRYVHARKFTQTNKYNNKQTSNGKISNFRMKYPSYVQLLKYILHFYV